MNDEMDVLNNLCTFPSANDDLDAIIVSKDSQRRTYKRERVTYNISICSSIQFIHSFFHLYIFICVIVVLFLHILILLRFSFVVAVVILSLSLSVYLSATLMLSSFIIYSSVSICCYCLVGLAASFVFRK